MQTYTFPGVTQTRLPEPQQKAILVWNEPEDVHLYWEFTGTEKELKLFDQELTHYNEWIDKYLLEGLAPLCSYRQDEGDEPNQILIAQSLDYQEIFGRPGGRVYYELREHGGFSFDLVYVDGPTPNDDDDFTREIDDVIREEYHAGRLTLEPLRTLQDIITQPCSISEEFALGYRLLPMTQRLIKRTM